MTQRGRKSQAALEVVTPATIERVERIKPPAGLGHLGAATFRRVVEDLPADWLTERNRDMLVQYCRHVVAADRAAQIIAQLEQDAELDIAALDVAYKMQERQSQRIESLATKMRISPQATTNHRGNKMKGLTGRKLWEDV